MSTACAPPPPHTHTRARACTHTHTHAPHRHPHPTPPSLHCVAAPVSAGITPPDYGCRQTTTSVPLRTAPCSTASTAATLPAGSFIHFTGERPASTCRDGLPWIKVIWNNQARYLSTAGSSGSSTVKYCPLMEADPSPYPKSGNTFIDWAAPGATAMMRAANVPASVTLAQAILESGWGTSAVAKNAYNYFGIKGTGPCGSYSGYRKYCSIQQGMEDHAWFFLDNSRYQAAMAQCKNSIEFARLIAAAGYAEASNYFTELSRIINEYNLNRFDLAFA